MPKMIQQDHFTITFHNCYVMYSLEIPWFLFLKKLELDKLVLET